MKKIGASLFLLICNFFVAAQNKETDSLLQIFSKTKNDSIKVSVLNKIAYQYIFNDEKTARNYLKKSEKIALSKHLKFGYDEIINIKGHGPLFKAFSYEIGKDLTFNINNILDAEFLNLENTPALAIGNLSKRWKNIFQKN